MTRLIAGSECPLWVQSRYMPCTSACPLSVRTKPASEFPAVSFAVAEPRAPLARALARVIPRDLGNAIDRPQFSQVILLKPDPPRAKLTHEWLDVVDFPAHLRARAGLHSR